MLQLSNIKLQASSKQFSKQSKKLIRFSYRNSIITTRNNCIFVNQATIKWDEKLRLPEVYNQDFDFEIYNEHQFGYNPEELHNLLIGTVRFGQNKSMGKWEVYDGDNRKIGYIYVDFNKISKASFQNKREEPAPTATKIVSSILVRNLKNAPESAYLTVNTGKKNYKSQSVEQLKGQFFYNLMFKKEQHLIKSINSKDVLIITLFGPNNQVIGTSKYSFRTQSLLTKLQIIDDLDNNVGDMYFEVQKIQPVAAKAQQNQQVQQPKPQKKASQSNLTLSKLRSLSTTSLSRLGQSQFLGTSRRKKMSVVHNNNDVVFPSQKRFMLYEDKQTNIISYSKLPSMRFQEEHSRKYYKGASIGKGNKSDFTLYYKHNPGVGQYKLPSIFDRY